MAVNDIHKRVLILTPFLVLVISCSGWGVAMGNQDQSSTITLYDAWSGKDILTEKIEYTESEWEQMLSPEAF